VNAGDAGQSRFYAYDQAGNMTKNTGLCAGDNTLVYPAQGVSSGRPHAPVSICGEPVAYDANGNTTDYTAAGVRKRLFYDAENRPIEVREVDPATGVAISSLAKYAYGPDGERLRKLSSAGALATWYLGGDVELETASTGTTGYSHYLHADVMRRGGSLRYLHKDHLSSNRLITSATGAIVQRLA
jgi:YD repeat-containing protein